MGPEAGILPGTSMMAEAMKELSRILGRMTMDMETTEMVIRIPTRTLKLNPKVVRRRSDTEVLRKTMNFPETTMANQA